METGQEGASSLDYSPPQTVSPLARNVFQRPTAAGFAAMRKTFSQLEYASEIDKKENSEETDSPEQFDFKEVVEIAEPAALTAQEEMERSRGAFMDTSDYSADSDKNTDEAEPRIDNGD